MSIAQEFEGHLRRTREVLRATGHELDWILNDGASEGQVVACETFIGRPLPSDFREFLRMHDGASLAVDHDPRLSFELTILRTSRIMEVHAQSERFYEDVGRDGTRELEAHADVSARFWDDLIAFAHYGIGLCVFDINAQCLSKCAVRDLDTENLEATRARIIAVSFDDWIARLLSSAVEEYSLIYWIPALEETD